MKRRKGPGQRPKSWVYKVGALTLPRRDTHHTTHSARRFCHSKPRKPAVRWGRFREAGHRRICVVVPSAGRRGRDPRSSWAIDASCGICIGE